MLLSILRILAYVLGIAGSAFLLPLAVAIADSDRRMALAFLVPLLAGWSAAMAFWFAVRKHPKVFDVKSAFGVVGLIWVAICIFGAVPLHFSGAFPSFSDAMFESVSGFTTTGASVLGDVETLPRSVNLWRCETHWLGGMGIIALAVALIPLLGIGGFRLIKAETTGPDKEKLTSFIANTAKSLWMIYVVLTALQTALLHLAGMGWTDSLAHAFSTMGTGGFSTRNASVGAFGLPAAEWICTAFMLAASVNFALYYRISTGRIRDVAADSELRAVAAIVLVSAAVTTLLESNSATAASRTLREVCFQISSVVSTTGFMTADYTQWRPPSQVAILLLFFIGGCSGSTAGGIKVIRWTILAKEIGNEMRRIVHPHQVFTLRINGKSGYESFIPVVSSFVLTYFILVISTTFAGAIAGLDIFTSFTAAASMVGNVGPAFGQLGPSANCGFLPAALKWWYCFAMLAGRLEIYTFLIMIARICHISGARASA
ncbi:MAG: TrkH family potassium uptake protein [Kiritimatiellae bacterium]|nr:TrkH family potassium uptake protein [Kiritimatiellia bacterium]